MEGFAGKTFVVRVDEASAFAAQTTFFDDLAYLTRRNVHAIIVAPSPKACRALVRSINRRGNMAVGLSGADAAMLPGSGRGIGNVQTGILETLTGAGYIPVIEPTAFSVFAAHDRTVAPDEVAQAVAAATDAVRAMFFQRSGRRPGPEKRGRHQRTHAGRSARYSRGSPRTRRPASGDSRCSARRAGRRCAGADRRWTRRARNGRRITNRASFGHARNGQRLYRRGVMQGLAAPLQR